MTFNGFSTFLLILLLGDIRVAALPEETCINVFGNTVTGLKPYLNIFDNENAFEACQSFWHCRVTNVSSIPNGSNRVNQPKPPPPHFLYPPVKAFRYYCADADPYKPFYDAKTCNCVATNDHCKTQNNFNPEFACTRPYFNNSGGVEPSESCRAFGKDENTLYYLGNFANFVDPSKYWSCEPSFQFPKLITTTTARLMDCASPGLIWNASKGKCDFTPNRDEVYRIHQWNIHPMNRFKNAKPLFRNETKPLI